MKLLKEGPPTEATKQQEELRRLMIRMRRHRRNW
jgi:hypothetical protein